MKRTTSIVLAIAMSASILGAVGCGPTVSNDENTVQIYAFSGGYGIEWLKEMEKKYEAKNPNVKIEISSDGMIGKADAMVRAGEVQTTDLYFTSDPIMKWLHEGNGVVKGYDFVLEPLDEVYEYKPIAGDERTVADLMNDSYEQNCQYSYYDEDDEEVTHYFALPWSGNVTGIVYNKTLFEENNIPVPRTTEELWEVCAAIKAIDGKIPFVSSTQTDYAEYLLQTWITQYMTVKEVNYFWNGKDRNGVFGPSLWTHEGRLYALQAYEKMLGVDYGNSHKNVNSMTFTQAQAQLLNGNCLMMVNGDWFENEMKDKAGDYTLDIMNAPVLSNIVEKTSFKDDANAETILRETISYIDGVEGATKPAQATDADVAIIREARRVTYGLLNHNAYIPAYSTAKQAAKDFLKYVCTQEAFDIYVDKTGGGILPLDYEVKQSSFSAMQKSKMEMYNKAVFVPMTAKYAMFHTGGLRYFLGVSSSVASSFTAKNPADRKTAQYIYDHTIEMGTQSAFDKIAEKAGVI
ncbi:MAG: extracellular solute-binding protein [Clostridia bacterium]|nr:extracellular solute-binding protein [Clostridia bacterium]